MFPGQQEAVGDPLANWGDGISHNLNSISFTGVSDILPSKHGRTAFQASVSTSTGAWWRTEPWAMGTMPETTIYHNPNCGTSQKVLAMLREAGLEPRIIEYLRAPPTHKELVSLLTQMGMRPRDILRRKDSVYQELGLDDLSLGDDAVIDAILSYPVLLERPIVITPKGVGLCRPAETVKRLL